MGKLEGSTCRRRGGRSISAHPFTCHIRPSLTAFDRALPDLESHVVQEER
jgi:hypothetical protein